MIRPYSDSTDPHHRFHAEQVGYKKTLGRRHVQMISLGGAIGTGLFLGTASRLHSVGPALLFSYAFVGVIAYFLLRALGELVLYRTTSGAWVSYMREFFGERAAFVTGWIYWLAWALAGVAELSAVGLYVQFWFPQIPSWITVLVALTVVLAINLLSARAFGEFEFWAAIAKVAAIVVFLAVGIVTVILGFHIGDHRAGVSNLWSNPGGFWPIASPYAWYGPLLMMSSIVFAYAGAEMIGVAAGEMQNAEREVPKAIKAVIFRIAVFYCGSILLLACMLPTREYTADTSPFVSVFERMGLTWIAGLIQAILITAALSTLNSGLYVTGRVLRSLAISKEAPACTLKMSSNGVPWAGVVMTSAVFVLGAALNYAVPDAFEIAVEATAVGVVFTWASIFLCQLRFRHLVDHGVIPASRFPAPGHPWTSILGLSFLVFVLVGMAIAGWQSSPYLWDKTGFIVVVLGISIPLAIATVGWAIVKPAVVAHSDGRTKAIWSSTGPDRGAVTEPGTLDVLAETEDR